MVYYEDWIIQDYAISMATAIVSIYTPEGFLIAADGLDYDSDRGLAVRKDVQKIYPVQQAGNVLAFSFTGTDRITRRGESTIVFDYIDVVLKSAGAAKDLEFAELFDYARFLFGAVWPLPQSAINAIRTFPCSSESPQDTTVFIEGFWNGSHKRAQLVFCNKNQKTDLFFGSPTIGMVYGATPDLIREIVGGNGDHRLTAFRANTKGTQTLAEAQCVARALMDACMSEEAKAIDPKCVAIGGHVHICKITKQVGFEWIIKPLQEGG